MGGTRQGVGVAVFHQEGIGVKAVQGFSQAVQSGLPVDDLTLPDNPPPDPGPTLRRDTPVHENAAYALPNEANREP